MHELLVCGQFCGFLLQGGPCFDFMGELGLECLELFVGGPGACLQSLGPELDFGKLGLDILFEAVDLLEDRGAERALVHVLAGELPADGLVLAMRLLEMGLGLAGDGPALLQLSGRLPMGDPALLTDHDHLLLELGHLLEDASEDGQVLGALARVDHLADLEQGLVVLGELPLEGLHGHPVLIDPPLQGLQQLLHQLPDPVLQHEPLVLLVLVLLGHFMKRNPTCTKVTIL
jgi:hypothetical protein